MRERRNILDNTGVQLWTQLTEEDYAMKREMTCHADSTISFVVQPRIALFARHFSARLQVLPVIRSAQRYSI